MHPEPMRYTRPHGYEAQLADPAILVARLTQAARFHTHLENAMPPASWRHFRFCAQWLVVSITGTDHRNTIP